MTGNVKSGVLVLGAGIAGIKSSLELAEMGIKVYLCDRRPYIGGALTRLDRWFPDNHCGMCQLLPVFYRDRSSQYCLRKGLVHPNIELMPLTRLKDVEGEAGDFRVTLDVKSSWVKPELCTGCGLCEQVCPIEVDSQFDAGLIKHKAIYLRHPVALPRIYTIDETKCTKCNACVAKCPSGAVDLSIHDITKSIEVGSVIVATGFEEFNPLPAAEYGYKRYPNVITSVEVERLLSPGGPSKGNLVRPSDGRVAKSVAFLQCVGSRSIRNNYCSSACCMYAVKEATMLKKVHPDIDVQIFFMDIRTFGKGYYSYFERAKEELGIKFTRCRVPVIKQDFKTETLLITARNEQNQLITERFDMVVLSVGQTPSPEFEETSRILGLESDRWGFCQTRQLCSVETNRDGVYVCGSASGPKDIADSITEAMAAAGEASSWVKPDTVASNLPELVRDEEPKIAVLVCSCESQINRDVDIDELISFCKGLPGIAAVEKIDHLCRSDVWAREKAKIKESHANRVIFAACSTIRPYMLSEEIPAEVVDIREGLAWVHKNGRKSATDKGKSLIAMALEKISSQESQAPGIETMTPKAIVIGGGLAGLTAAQCIAESGFNVEIIEKSGIIGGNARHVCTLLQGGDPPEYLKQLIAKVEANPLVHFRKETELVNLTGYLGSYKCTLKDKSSRHEETDAGVIIVAPGGEESKPTEYLYGQSEQVVTQRELEERLWSGNLNPKILKSVVMIQCVGSRDKTRPYCSRICCSQALKNALTLKDRNHDLEVVIFYRDIMSYGLKEEYYTLAREKGVIFIRYDTEQKPEVIKDDTGITVKAVEPELGGSVVIKPDLVVLSPPIVSPGNAGLAGTLGIELTPDGFFKEAEAKFLTVDSTKPGIFICGLANSPRDMGETIVQAQAASHRASTLLARGKLSASRMVSHVNARRCSGCELCVKACRYDARAKDSEMGIVRVREALCQGCGACVVACPNGASSLSELRHKQLFSVLDAALSL